MTVADLRPGATRRDSSASQDFSAPLAAAGLHASVHAHDLLAGARLRGEARPELVRDELLSEIWSATVAERPGHPVHIVDGHATSYAEADATARLWALGLVARGIGPGDVVGLWMARGSELLVAQIAITLTGAAWLPFDADAPVDRIATCLKDCDAKALFTSAALAERAAGTGVAVVTPPALTDAANASSGTLLDPRGRGATPASPAYMIYTSGSTGVPKGIVVSQGNICHFLRSGNALYGFEPSDVVFQGASVAFDLSMEEIWIPYMVGATLLVATPAMLGESDKLATVLTEANVTVLDTVPTLLSMLAGDVPSVRLILLGGEALPPGLVTRFSREGRRILNTYGPTEATVVATACEVFPDKPVTIGRPIANYSAYVVDEALNPVAPGVEGELLIGGPGVAQGYLRRPELTAQKFVANPFPSDGTDPILYRSGDAVSVTPAGEIAFHGRIDDQVKVRGFRVELGEIEAKLAEREEVAQAAVVLRNDNGLDQLVAFLVQKRDSGLDSLVLRAALRESLPPYMVPTRFEAIQDLPRLPSGKVDRKALKARELAVVDTAGEQDAAETETEEKLLAAAQRVFPGQAVPFTADFFTDLGGHSLLAARFVSFLRETPELATVTLQDVYAKRSLRALGAHLDEMRGEAGEALDTSFEPPPLLRRFLCGLAQAVSLPVIIGLMTAQWLGVFISYTLLVNSEMQVGFLAEMLMLMGVYVGITVLSKIIGIAGKWIVLGRTKPGRYPIWGVYYFRWWLANRFLSLTHAKFFQGTAVMPFYLRLLGARVGRDTFISEFESGVPDLISIDDDAVIGQKVKLANAVVVGNELVISEIRIGKDAYIGTSCTIEGGSTIGDGAELADLTAIPAGTTVGAGERWDGSPGRKVGMADPAHLPERAEASPGVRLRNNLIYVAALLIIPALSLLPIFPAFFVFDRINDATHLYVETAGLADILRNASVLVLLTWPTAIAMIVSTVALVIAARWIILPKRVSAGTYSIHSGFYVRKWLIGLMTDVTLDTLTSLFATIYMRFWYRLMGARIGPGSEVSTNFAGRYDLIDIGAKNFIADEVILGDEDIRRGWMTLAEVKTGDRVFVGNEGVVAPGTTIASGTLIGVKSKPPSLNVGPDETWFGSPPLKFPTRQRVSGVEANWTFEPSIWRKLARAGFEALHTSLPTALTITCGFTAVDLLTPAIAARDFPRLVLGFMIAGVAISLVLTACVIVLKWLLMGRYRPVMKPMWSFWAMRTEAVAVMYWGMAGKILLEHLRGTPFLPWILRPFGVKTGQGVFMNSTDITEFDCVTIGDFASVNQGAALQTHLYEDRVMKVGTIELGRGVTVGASGIVLYDTKIGDFARLGPLTMVMKGESIPARTSWEGSPAQPARRVPKPEDALAPLKLAAE